MDQTLFCLSLRLYDALLGLYPTAFQREYRAEMLRCFRDSYREMYLRQGHWALPGLWLWALADLARTIPAEHLDEGDYLMTLTRLGDSLVASLGLLLSWPIMGLTALLIKLDSPGPILYRSVRVGAGGRPFTMYKFRTMSTLETLPPDARITRMGRLLRRFSLDELPQLLNVLRGEMALIGPRPGLPSAPPSPTITPGITGPSQLGEEEPEKEQPRSLRHDARLLLASLRYILWAKK